MFSFIIFGLVLANVASTGPILELGDMCITIRTLSKVVRSLGDASAPSTKRRRVPRSVADGFAAAGLPARTRAELLADARARKQQLRKARLHTEQPQQLALVRAPTVSLRLVPGHVLQKLIATNTVGAAMDTTSLMMSFVAAARCEPRSGEHNLCDENSTAPYRYLLLDPAGIMGSKRNIELATSVSVRKIGPYVVRLAAYLVLEDCCARATIEKEFTRRYPDCLELYVECCSSDETPMAVSLVDESRNSGPSAALQQQVHAGTGGGGDQLQQYTSLGNAIRQKRSQTTIKLLQSQQMYGMLVCESDGTFTSFVGTTLNWRQRLQSTKGECLFGAVLQQQGLSAAAQLVKRKLRMTALDRAGSIRGQSVPSAFADARAGRTSMSIAGCICFPDASSSRRLSTTPSLQA
jgi:hypothetical protein